MASPLNLETGEFHRRKQIRLSGWVTEKRAFFRTGRETVVRRRQSEGSKAVIKLPLYERDVNGPLPSRPKQASKRSCEVEKILLELTNAAVPSS